MSSEVLLHSHSFTWSCSSCSPVNSSNNNIERHIVLIGYIDPTQVQHHSVKITIEPSPFRYVWANSDYQPIHGPQQTTGLIEELFVDPGTHYRLHLDPTGKIVNSLTVIITLQPEFTPQLIDSRRFDHWIIIAPKSLSIAEAKHYEIFTYDDPHSQSLSPKLPKHPKPSKPLKPNKKHQVDSETILDKKVPLGSVLRFQSPDGGLAECNPDWSIRHPVSMSANAIDQLVTFDQEGTYYFIDPHHPKRKTRVEVVGSIAGANPLQAINNQLGVNLQCNLQDPNLCLCLQQVNSLRQLAELEGTPALTEVQLKVGRCLIDKIMATYSPALVDQPKKVLLKWLEVDTDYSFKSLLQTINPTDNSQINPQALQPLMAERLTLSVEVRRKIISQLKTC